MRSWILLLTTDNYLLSVIGIITALQATNTKYPIACCISDELKQETIDILQQLNIDIIHIGSFIPTGRTLEEGHNLIGTTSGWHLGLAKLKVFSLYQYDKIVFLDTDMWILDNIDELFEYPNLTMASDFSGLKQQNELSSGIMVIEPNENDYNNIIKAYNKITDDYIHDQLVLRKAFPQWRKCKYLQLSKYYGYWASFFDNYAEEEYYFRIKNYKIIHFACDKPWIIGKESFYEWFDSWPIYSKLGLEYIDMINYGIEKYHLNINKIT